MSGTGLQRSVILWLVRHGRTEWNAGGRLQGWSDIPLDEEGRSQARGLRDQLEGMSFAGVWSSDLRRAVETAEIALRPPTIDRRLREMDFGELEGTTWEDLGDDLRRSLRSFDDFVAPGGESATSFMDRIESFLAELEPGHHAVFTHGGVIRAVARACGSEGFPGHASVVRLDWTDRSPLDRSP